MDRVEGKLALRGYSRPAARPPTNRWRRSPSRPRRGPAGPCAKGIVGRGNRLAITYQLRTFSQVSLGWGLYKRNARKSISWQTFLEASEAVLIGSRDERVGQKLRPITSDTGPGVYIYSGETPNLPRRASFPSRRRPSPFLTSKYYDISRLSNYAPTTPWEDAAAAADPAAPRSPRASASLS